MLLELSITVSLILMMLPGVRTVTLGGDLCRDGLLPEGRGGEHDFIRLIFFTTLCSLVASWYTLNSMSLVSCE